MDHVEIRKHIFYGTLLVCLFLGTLGSVFRGDFTGKAVTVVCAAILFAISVAHYIWRHRSLP
jgi:hypothetical protein